MKVIRQAMEVIDVILVILSVNGIVINQDGVKSVYVEFKDGTSERFSSEYTDDVVILNQSEVKYIYADFSEEE